MRDGPDPPGAHIWVPPTLLAGRAPYPSEALTVAALRLPVAMGRRLSLTSSPKAVTLKISCAALIDMDLGIDKAEEHVISVVREERRRDHAGWRGEVEQIEVVPRLGPHRPSRGEDSVDVDPRFTGPGVACSSALTEFT